MVRICVWRHIAAARSENYSTRLAVTPKISAYNINTFPGRVPLQRLRLRACPLPLLSAETRLNPATAFPQHHLPGQGVPFFCPALQYNFFPLHQTQQPLHTPVENEPYRALTPLLTTVHRPLTTPLPCPYRPPTHR